MPSQVQEVLSRPSAGETTDPAEVVVTAALTPHGKVTAHFTRKAVTASLGGGLVLAVGAAALFHARTGSGATGMIGLGLIVWAVATAAIALALGMIPYVSVRRRLR
jgi:hypothetical protein